MQVDLTSNYFELFGLPVGFDVDLQRLQSRYQELQKVLHPDNFAAASDAEKRWSMQAAATLNDAQATLKKPLARATYLLRMNDVDLDTETDTQMSPQFLMCQMELRERMEDISSKADPYSEVESVRAEISELTSETSAQFAGSFSSNDFAVARDFARQWQFLDKLARETDDIEAALDEA